MNRREFLRSGAMLGAFTALISAPLISVRAAEKFFDGGDKLPFKKIVKTDEEWKKILTPEQYEVTRRAATEAPYSSPLTNEHRKGIFECVCCNLPIFSSRTKFDSGTGWASFYAPIAKINVAEKIDNSLPDETRTEVLCNRCDAHLGHVFNDGPKPTGLRYCMNGIALKFIRA